MSDENPGNRSESVHGVPTACQADCATGMGDSIEPFRSATNSDKYVDMSSMREISIIENMTSFLQANGGAELDSRVLRTIAEALSKRLNDTSPGTLQDVTMEHTYGVGYRSPCVSLQQSHGNTSPPVQGRSVREFEEQMASLRKENFNLKLRLYFLEESVPGYQQSNADGQETLMKQLIDAKVEMEILRKEIQEKQEILKEAAQAMNQMEQIQKETEAKSQAVIDELKQKIQFLEMERDMDKSHHSGFMNDLLGRSDISENVNALQKIRELEGIVKHSEDKMVDFQHQILKLENIVAKRDETIKEYEEKVKELAFQNAELLEAVENKEKEVACAERNIRGLRLSNADLKEDNQHLIDALKATQDNFRKEMSNMKLCERQMREQQDALSKMQSQHLREELRGQKIELADKICMLEEVEEKLKNRTQLHEQACRTIRKLMQVLKGHQDEIKRLKKNTPGEALSNKEDGSASGNGSVAAGDSECTGLCRSLSDSEAFNEFCGAQKQKYETIIEEQENTIKCLNIEVKKKTAALQNLINNELWEKNREIERLTKLINNNSATVALSPSATQKEEKHDLQQSFTEEDYSKALKHNKLLQRKVDVLNQRLGAERSSAELITQLRKDVRNARAETENAEKWRRECADVCSILSTRLEELAGFLNSLLKHKDVLGFLAADRRRAMRNAVNTSLDLSKSLNMTLSVTGLSIGDHSLLQLSNISCLLAECDTENKTFNTHDQLRSRHSMDTLQAENKALGKELDNRRGTDLKKDRRSLPVLLLDNQSESEAWSEPDRKVSLARIGLEDHSVSLVKEQQQTQQADTDSESEGDALHQSRISKTRSQDRITQLEQLIAQRDERILAVQCQLVETDNCLKKETLRVIDLTQELEELRQRNEQLYIDIIAIGDENVDNGNPSIDSVFNKSLLQREIEEKTRSLEKVREERDRIAVEARLAEVQIGALKADLADLKVKHDGELKLASEQQKQLLEKLQDMENLLEHRLNEQEKAHEDALKCNWVERVLYEEVKTQLTDLQAQYAEAQRTIDYLTENEQELKQTLVDNELAARALKKQLDESTLQASKVIMERTKVCNEKLQLEQRLQKLVQRTKEQEKECNTLQQRVGELERTQRLLNEQIARTTATVRTSGSETSQSGYTSEEVVQMCVNANASENITALEPCVTTESTKRQNNSSPDLGIESDAGRVSSVELSNAQRSLLKIVELPATSSEPGDIKQEFDSNGENDMKVANVMQHTAEITTAGVAALHDCAKVEQENVELRRKLVRTQRAFENIHEKLRITNQRKARVEREIKNQIIQTHSVLKNVRSNMEE